MATTIRQIDHSLAEDSLLKTLEKEPFRFQFFQAVRLWQQLAPGKPVGKFFTPADEVVRFSARATLEFPASELQELRYRCPFCPSAFANLSEAEKHFSDCKQREGRTRRFGPPRLTVNFMGLTGPQGVLPTCYSELIIDRSKKRDLALPDFLDIFNHRLISLFYQSWEKYRFGVQYEQGREDHLSRNLAALVGLGIAGLRNRLLEVPDESLLYYTGLLSQQPHSAVALEQILRDYFNVPAEVMQFQGRWYYLSPDNSTRLQETDSLCDCLGVGSVLGDEVWDQQSLVRVRLGPMPLNRYIEFLPNGKAYQSLRSLVQFYCSGQLDFEVQLALQDEQTPPCALDVEGETGPQLGWITWIKSAPLGHYVGETVFRF